MVLLGNCWVCWEAAGFVGKLLGLLGNCWVFWHVGESIYGVDEFFFALKFHFVVCCASIGINDVMELSERLVCLAAETLIILNESDLAFLPNPLKDQLVKSSSSPGANYEEAQAASSRRDFHHKCKISLRELRETHYWFRVIQKSGLKDPRVNELISETAELVKIFVTICKKTDPKNKTLSK